METLKNVYQIQPNHTTWGNQDLTPLFFFILLTQALLETEHFQCFEWATPDNNFRFNGKPIINES